MEQKNLLEAFALELDEDTGILAQLKTIAFELKRIASALERRNALH